MTRVCLSMMVKNEAHIIERAMRSAMPFVNCIVVCDTGSTDGTRETARRLIHEAGLPGTVVDQPWVDFGHNRTEAIRAARTFSVCDYTLILDGDETLRPLVGFDGFGKLTDASYALKIETVGNDTSYWLQRLILASLDWRYVGATHEYLTSSVGSYVQFHGAGLLSHADSARRKSGTKFTNDIEILTAELQRDPEGKDAARNVFYLAQSYRDSGDFARAADQYWRRATMGGWEEEAWYALYQYAVMAELLNDDPGEVMFRYAMAYQFRPQRAESLYQLARYCRGRNMFALSAMYAKQAAEINRPNDVVFMDEAVYTWKSLDEYAVALYHLGQKQGASIVLGGLLRDFDLPDDHRLRVESNLALCAE